MARYSKIFMIYSLFIKNIFCESYINDQLIKIISKEFINSKKNQDDFILLSFLDDKKETRLMPDKDKLYKLNYDNKKNKVIIEDLYKKTKIKEIDLNNKEYGYFTIYFSGNDNNKVDILISDLSERKNTLFDIACKIEKIEIHELKCKNLSKLFEFMMFLKEIVINKEIEANNLEKTFYSCDQLKKINFENIKVLEGCNCNDCFKSCDIKYIKTNKYFKPGNLTNMFNCCKILENVELNFSDDYNKEEIVFGDPFIFCKELKNIKGFEKFKKFKDCLVFNGLDLDELDLSNLEDKLPCEGCTIGNLIISNKFIEKNLGSNSGNTIKKITIKGLKTKNGNKDIVITDSDAIKDFIHSPSLFSSTLDYQFNSDVNKKSCFTRCSNSGKDNRKKYNIS